LLHKLAPRARVYVINLDAFFEDGGDIPGRIVMEQPDALSNYRRKQIWQNVHSVVCGRLAELCGNSYAIFRTRNTGAWQASGAISAKQAVSVDSKVDAEMVARDTAAGSKFLDSLNVDRSCVIFTLVPTVDTPSATSSTIAAALHVDFIAPNVDDLMTFDGSHLDRASAERWSTAFFDAAGPKIRECVQRHATTAIASLKE